MSERESVCESDRWSGVSWLIADPHGLPPLFFFFLFCWSVGVQILDAFDRKSQAVKEGRPDADSMEIVNTQGMVLGDGVMCWWGMGLFTSGN